MKRLLEHLRAHMRTQDPYILVYDSEGTFDDCVGNIIVTGFGSSGHGSFLGVPVRRDIDFSDALALTPRFQVRVSRVHLMDLIARIEYQERMRGHAA